MKYKSFLVAVILVVAISCKKKSSTIAETCSDGIKNQNETEIDCGGSCSPCPILLCDGNSSNTYLPLKVGNSWSLDGPAQNDITLTVSSSTESFNSLNYFKVTYSLSGADYYRVAANGDIMEYNSTDNTEYLSIPANPTNNQSWTYPLNFSKTRKVISTNASVNTSKCSYTGCLKLQEFAANGDASTTTYYKKGLGIIRTDQIWPGYVTSDLTSVTLK
jgi:hypothetical protein